MPAHNKKNWWLLSIGLVLTVYSTVFFLLFLIFAMVFGGKIPNLTEFLSFLVGGLGQGGPPGLFSRMIFFIYFPGLFGLYFIYLGLRSKKSE